MLDQLNQLKNLDAKRVDIEEAVALSAYGRSLSAEYDLLKVDAPQWLEDRLRELRREIRARVQDALDLRIKTVRAQLDATLTAAEKREKLQKELAALESATATTV